MKEPKSIFIALIERKILCFLHRFGMIAGGLLKRNFMLMLKTKKRLKKIETLKKTIFYY
jgi:hypothetical protein